MTIGETKYEETTIIVRQVNMKKITVLMTVAIVVSLSFFPSQEKEPELYLDSFDKAFIAYC